MSVVTFYRALGLTHSNICTFRDVAELLPSILLEVGTSWVDIDSDIYVTRATFTSKRIYSTPGILKHDLIFFKSQTNVSNNAIWVLAKTAPVLREFSDTLSDALRSETPAFLRLKLHILVNALRQGETMNSTLRLAALAIRLYNDEKISSTVLYAKGSMSVETSDLYEQIRGNYKMMLRSCRLVSNTSFGMYADSLGNFSIPVSEDENDSQNSMQSTLKSLGELFTYWDAHSMIDQVFDNPIPKKGVIPILEPNKAMML